MKIAVIGDAHYSNMKGKSKLYKQFRDDYFSYFFDFFFKQKADLYVSLGDLTNFGTKKEYKGIYSHIPDKRNFIHVVGNHDLFTATKEDFEDRTGYKRYSCMDKKDIRLIFLDTCKQKFFLNPRGKIDIEQVKWLEEKLKFPDNKYVIVFAHHPIAEVDVVDSKGKDIEDIKFHDILMKRNGKSVYLNAHIHRDRLRVLENWMSLQFADILNFPSVRMLDIRKDSVQVKTIKLKDNHYEKMGAFVSSGVRTFKQQHYENVCLEPWIRNLTFYSKGKDSQINFDIPAVYSSQNACEVKDGIIRHVTSSARNIIFRKKIEKHEIIETNKEIVEESQTMVWDLIQDPNND